MPTPSRQGGSPRGGTESVAQALRECVDDPVRGVRRLATSHAAMQLQRSAMLSYETAKNNVGAVWRKYQSGELFNANTVEAVKRYALDLAAKAHVQVAGLISSVSTPSPASLPLSSPPSSPPSLSSSSSSYGPPSTPPPPKSRNSPLPPPSHRSPPPPPPSPLSTHRLAYSLRVKTCWRHTVGL
ncbi:hypothetical protein CLOP_g1342 [Closterium sp. NIES-67]|nr:hypothetical protein CLOP_g1342 [Closterium sp. NIES-67]